MADTSIEWTNKSWNPLRARNLETGGVGHYCEKVSPGCANCYAARMQPRFKNAIRYNAADRDKVELFLDEDVLQEPLRWRKPQNIFVCSMTDLFADFYTDEWLDSIFGVMGACDDQERGHVFQVLTKRAGRALDYMGTRARAAWNSRRMNRSAFPPRNVHLGVSVEDQKTADERIPLLLQTPAALRWLSVEPLLEAVDLYLGQCRTCAGTGETAGHYFSPDGCGRCDDCRGDGEDDGNLVDWCVVGGESGPGARAFNVEWAESIIGQCRSASVPVFVKQLGAQPVDLRSDEPEVPPYEFHLSDRKGGDMSEWPESLRVRQFPHERSL